MYKGFRNKKSVTSCEFDRLIKELKEENANQNEELKKILNELYEKNKKDNEIKGAFDLVLKILIITLFIFAIVFFACMIVYVWKYNASTIQNKVVLTVDIGLIITILIFMIIQIWKEKNRNYIMTCVTMIIALIALIVALSK